MAQRLRTIFALRRLKTLLEDGIGRAAERDDDYIIEARVLIQTINEAARRVDAIIDQLKRKSPGADDTEARS